MKISEIITDKYKLRIPPTVYYELLADVFEAEEEQKPKTIGEKQAESQKYQKAFDDGYENGYAQARFDYEQEPCTDAVSRQYLVDKIKELFEMGDCHCDKYSIIGTINQAPSVNPNVCIDTVSRQAVQEANTISIELKENPHQMWQRIQNLPSVTPTRPKGKWIMTNDFLINLDGQFIYKFICSECKSLSYFRTSNKKAIGANVCPNCGARMESEEA